MILTYKFKICCRFRNPPRRCDSNTSITTNLSASNHRADLHEHLSECRDLISIMYNTARTCIWRSRYGSRKLVSFKRMFACRSPSPSPNYRRSIILSSGVAHAHLPTASDSQHGCGSCPRFDFNAPPWRAPHLLPLAAKSAVSASHSSQNSLGVTRDVSDSLHVTCTLTY